MAVWASIVTCVMGFAAALLLFEATTQRPPGGRARDGQAMDAASFQAKQRKLRTLGIAAAVVAVIAAYVAAFSA